MICLEHLTIEYDRLILDDATIKLYPGCLSLLQGRSGVGKSTLLYRIGLISEDSSYDYYLDDHKVDLTDNHQRSLICKNLIGYVLQESNLLEQYNVIENLQHASLLNDEAFDGQAILEQVRLDVPLDQDVKTLSGGERQRLAIACALVKKPQILILDEPTNSLDKENERLIFEILSDLASRLGIYVIVASHSKIALDYAQNIYTIEQRQVIAKIQKKNEMKLKYGQLKNFSRKFFKYYQKHFTKYYRVQGWLIKIILGISAISMFLVAAIIDNKLNQNLSNINTLSNNQLVVSDHKDNLYLDHDHLTSTSITLAKLQAIDDIEAVYPLYSLKSSIGGETCPIVPIYPENNLNGQVVQTFNKTSKPQLYLNLNTQKLLSANIIDHQLNGVIFNDDKEYLFEYGISALINNNSICAYLESSNTYIYLDHQQINEMAASLQLTSQPIGYTVFCQSIEQLEEVEKELLKNGYFVNDTFQNKKVLAKLNLQLQQTKLVLILFIEIFSTVMILILINNYLGKRKKEFALLKINGLGNLDLTKLVLFELVIFNLIGFVLPCILSIGVISFSGLTLDLTIIAVILLLQIAAMIICLAVNIIKIKHLYPDLVLRD